MAVGKTWIGLHLFIPRDSIPYLLSVSELQGLIQSSPIQVLLMPFSHWAIINSVYSAQVDQATGPARVLTKSQPMSLKAWIPLYGGLHHFLSMLT